MHGPSLQLGAAKQPDIAGFSRAIGGVAGSEKKAESGKNTENHDGSGGCGRAPLCRRDGAAHRSALTGPAHRVEDRN